MSYSQALADLICTELMGGKSLRAICREFGLGESTVRDWQQTHAEFGAQSLRARRIGCHALAEEALEIADTPCEGVEETTTTGEHGGTSTKRGDMLGHRRLQVDTRLRLIGKWNQHDYGDKLAVEQSGPNGGPVQHAVGLTDGELERIAAAAVRVK